MPATVRVTAEIEMVPLECASCGLMWTMSAKVYARSVDRQRANPSAPPIFCPSGHSQTPGKSDVLAELEALRQHVVGYEAERVDLLRRLEAAEARLAQHDKQVGERVLADLAARQRPDAAAPADPKGAAAAPLELTEAMRVKDGGKQPPPPPADGDAFRFDKAKA